jgi:hypothetical protein
MTASKNFALAQALKTVADWRSENPALAAAWEKEQKNRKRRERHIRAKGSRVPVTLRMSARLRNDISARADALGVSMNDLLTTWLNETLERAVSPVATEARARATPATKR